MWKAALLVTFGCLLCDEATSQGGAENLPFFGTLPIGHIREIPPVADPGRDDIYKYLGIRFPSLREDEVLIYPHPYGFEYGQDPEEGVYEVHKSKDLAAKQNQDHHKKHHKHEKHHHHHHHYDNEENEEARSAKFSHGGSDSRSPSGKQSSSYSSTSRHTQPRPSHPSYPSGPKKSSSGSSSSSSAGHYSTKKKSIPPHFG